MNESLTGKYNGNKATAWCTDSPKIPAGTKDQSRQDQSTHAAHRVQAIARI